MAVIVFKAVLQAKAGVILNLKLQSYGFILKKLEVFHAQNYANFVWRGENQHE